jgi:hypothetical protein
MSRRYSVNDSPSIHPFQVTECLVWSFHSPGDGHEQDVQPNSRRIQETVDSDLQVLILALEHPVCNEAKGKDGEVESRIVVVDIGDTSHSHEGTVVQEPSDHGVDTGVVDLVDVYLLELSITTLPAYEIPCDHECQDTKGSGRTPVDERVAEEEIFDNVVVPAAHTESDVQNGPLPELRGEIILLVGIRNQSVVGCHHGNVQVDEILQERRSVCSGISCRYCDLLAVNEQV